MLDKDRLRKATDRALSSAEEAERQIAQGDDAVMQRFVQARMRALDGVAVEMLHAAEAYAVEEANKGKAKIAFFYPLFGAGDAASLYEKKYTYKAAAGYDRENDRFFAIGQVPIRKEELIQLATALSPSSEYTRNSPAAIRERPMHNYCRWNDRDSFMRSALSRSSYDEKRLYHFSGYTNAEKNLLANILGLYNQAIADRVQRFEAEIAVTPVLYQSTDADIFLGESFNAFPKEWTSPMGQYLWWWDEGKAKQAGQTAARSWRVYGCLVSYAW